MKDPQIVRFGVFEADLNAGELRKSGTLVRLQEQPFQLLALFLERAGEVVTRDEVRQRIWPEDTFVDFDRSLNTAVNKIRDALGDSAETPRFIQTLPRRGYRFVCEVAGARTALSTRRRYVWIVVAGILLAAIATAIALRSSQNAAEAKLAMFTVPPPFQTTIREAVISPDGSRIVISASDASGKPALWVRELNSISPRLLAGTDGAIMPFWSPDSRFVGFFAGTRLYKVEASGGPVQFICEAGQPAGGTWGRDGTILFGRSLNGLARVASSGGQPQQFTKLDEEKKESRHYWPVILPDDRHFLYFSNSTSPEVLGLWVASLTNPAEKHRLLAEASMGVYSGGRLLFVRGGALMAQPMDLSRLRVSGEAVPVVYRVFSKAVGGFGAFSASANGTLVVIGDARPGRLTWYDRRGNSLGAFGAPGRYQFISLSPDQLRIAADAMSEVEAAYKLFVIDPVRGTTAQIMPGGATGNFPVWSPDGSRVAFASVRDGVYNLYVRRSTGAGEEEVLLKNAANKFVSDWSRDGRYLIYAERGRDSTNQDLWVLPMFGDRKPVSYLRAGATLRDARFSPDGRWVAYSSNESSATQIYVQSFPAGSEKVQISTTGGVQPRWRADGKELYYVAPEGELMSVDVKSGVRFQAGDPKPLFKTPITSIESGYEATQDGMRFVMLAPDDGLSQPSLTVVLNWTEGMKR